MQYLFYVLLPIFIACFAAIPIVRHLMRKKHPLSSRILLAVGVELAFLAMVVFTPEGWPFEIPVIALFALSIACFFALFFSLAHKAFFASTWGTWIAVAFLILYVLPGLFLPLTERLRFAAKLHWACDGIVIKKYLSGKNAMHTVRVQEQNGSEHDLADVPDDFYDRVQLNDHLQKAAGQTTASLNNQQVIIVEPRLYALHR